MKSMHQTATSPLWCHALHRKTWSMLMYFDVCWCMTAGSLAPDASILTAFFPDLIKTHPISKTFNLFPNEFVKKYKKERPFCNPHGLLWKSVALRAKYKMLLSDCSFLTWTNVPVRKLQSEINCHSARITHKLPVIVIAKTKQAETMSWVNRLTRVFISILHRKRRFQKHISLERPGDRIWNRMRPRRLEYNQRIMAVN